MNLVNENSVDSSVAVVSQLVWEDCRLSPAKLVIKRALDFILATITLILCFPLFLGISAAIKLDSPGPVLFSQTRVGKRGRKFTFYKFRSMTQDAEIVRDSLMHLNEASGPVFKISDDPRVTRVGRILRKYSLDEIPQILNVFRGDMSLVGPRPPLPCEVEQYKPHEWKRLSIRPGMTCLWQVGGRSDIPFEKWVELDVEYIRRQSLLLDFKILALTIPAVLFGRGAR